MPSASSDSAWLRTNVPCHGRCSSGHRLVTNRTRSPATGEREAVALALFDRATVPGIHPPTATPAGNSHRHRVVMLLENNPYPEDVRVRREAESLTRAGHAVCVVAPRRRGQPRRELVRGVAVRRFRAPEGGGVLGLLAEYAVAMVALHAVGIAELRRGATVLHLHNPPDTLFGLAALARLLGRRVVFDHHDLFPELVTVRFGSPAIAACAQAAERLTFATADRVLAANDSHARIARGRGGKPAAAVTVVRNGPPRDELVTEPTLRPGRLGDPHLVYVGALAEQDGAELLAELLARLRDDHALPGARLSVVGDGAGRALLEARARTLGVAGQVTRHRLGRARARPHVPPSGRPLRRPGPAQPAQRSLDDDQDRRVPRRGQARGRLRPARDGGHRRRRGAARGPRGRGRPGRRGGGARRRRRGSRGARRPSARPRRAT